MTQFEELVIALNPPAGILPPNITAQGNRAPELLRWVEGPTGPKLPQLQMVLNQILNIAPLSTDPETGHPSASRKRFYEKQKVQLEAALAAITLDLETAPREVDRMRL
ncbi:MAG: hypothetical protein AAFW95_12315, partial [Cyanobacteria bacterium J06638_6]